jgi:DNA-binding transcriptional regulator YiaG
MMDGSQHEELYMPGETTAWGQKQALRWTPHHIKRLRGKRTQAEFGALLGAPKNTVWRWEAGQAHPDARYAARLSELAEHEHFLADWQLVGSMTLLGDLESAKADIAKLFRKSLERTSRQLAE